METVTDMMLSLGFTKKQWNELPIYLQDEYGRFALWKLESMDGDEAAHILELAVPLLKACDPISHSSLWCGIMQALTVLFNSR
jgi:hypothetical protein